MLRLCRLRQCLPGGCHPHGGGKGRLRFSEGGLKQLYPVRKVCKDLPGAGDRPAEPERTGLPEPPMEPTRSEKSAPPARSLPCWPIMYFSGAAWSTVWPSTMSLRSSTRRITSMEELSALRRSKYVQSRVGLSYRQVKQDLKNGKTVLFSGTPCQNAWA